MTSLEQLKAERARRKGAQGRSAASYKMNKPRWWEAEAKLPFSKGVNENISGAIHGANRGFSKTFGFGKHVDDMKRAYERSMELNPASTRLGELGADIYKSAPFMAAGGGIANMLGLGGRAAGAAGGALGGGAEALAGNRNLDEDESGLTNFLMGAGGGALGGALFPGLTRDLRAAIGEIPGAMKQGAQAGMRGAGEYAESLSQPKTVNKMLGHFNELQGKYNKGYGDIFADPNMPQHLDLKLDKKAVKQLEKLIPGWNQNLKKAVKSKNPLDAHWAQSDLGRLTRQIEKRGIDMTPQQREILELAKPIRKQLKSTLDKALPEEAKGAYKEIGKEYAEEMGDKIPQKLRNALKDYEKGDIRPQDVLRRARGVNAEKYQTKYGNLFPGIGRAKHPSTLLNAGRASAPWLGGASLLGGGLKALDLLSPSRKKEQY